MMRTPAAEEERGLETAQYSFHDRPQRLPHLPADLQDLLMGERGGGDPGRGVRDRREAEAAHPPRPRDDHLRDGGHPHGVRAEPLQHPDLGGGLVRGAEQPDINPLLERDLRLPRHFPRQRPQPGVVGLTHVREALFPFQDGAGERVAEHEVDVVGDQHQRARPERESDAPGGVGDDQRPYAEARKYAHGQPAPLPGPPSPPPLAPPPRPCHSSIPASVADRKLASVPASMARRPSRARSCLRLGARAPIPPIWMPTELTLAKPHNAKVAMVNDTGSRLALRGPSWANAMNSFSTMRVPNSPAMVLVSCPGTPMTHAIG